MRKALLPNSKWGRVLLALFSIPAVAGCGEAAFSAHSRDNHPDDIRRALAASQMPPHGPQNATGHPMAILVTASSSTPGTVTSSRNRQLVGFDLGRGQVTWAVPADVRSRVVVGRALLFHRQGAYDLVGRDVASGQLKLTITLARTEHFVGMAAEGDRLYYVVQSMASGRRVSTVTALDGAGDVLWRISTKGMLGAPAVRGGVVAVPFSYQNLSLLDGHTGKELARVRATDEQISFVRALRQGFFYGGQRGIYLLDRKSASGSQKGSSYAEARLSLGQMRPPLYWDAYQQAQSDYTAFDRNRLLWTAEARDGTVAFGGDLAVLHNYRFLFAFDAKSGRLRWAFDNPRIDLVAAEALDSQVLYVSADGDIGAIDGRSGRGRRIAKTGLRVVGATFDAEGFAQVAVAALPGDLLGTLQQIVWDPDSRFTSVKVFAADAIGQLTGRAASAALLQIVRALGGVPPAVQKRAGEELMRRKDVSAAALYLEALKVHFDYLENSRPQGIDVLARAVAALRLKEAIPELCAHLLDPETPQSALPDVAAALGVLGGTEAARALQVFFLDYRSDPIFFDDPASLTKAAEALLKIGGPDERRAVVDAAEDRNTTPMLAKTLRVLIQNDRKEASAATKQ